MCKYSYNICIHSILDNVKDFMPFKITLKSKNMNKKYLPYKGLALQELIIIGEGQINPSYLTFVDVGL